MTKKIMTVICLMLAMVLASVLVGCGSDDKNENGPTPSSQAVNRDENKEENKPGNEEGTKDPTTAPEQTATPEPTPEESKRPESNDDGTVNADLTSLEMAARLGNGINLGNTFESKNRDYTHKTFTELTTVTNYRGAETGWGQPTTTPEMLKEMKAKGFDTIRIPIAWTTYMDNLAGGDYTINADFINRVEEVVNYALDAGMYVIINDHWDGGWWGAYGQKDENLAKTADALYTAMWTQIAEHFKDYSDRLIFEGGNEELGDSLNREFAGPKGTLSKDECFKEAARLNQLFVNTVRATGGNNELRFLLIPGYNTDIQETCDSRFIMPVDTAKDKLLLSVHYYTPWNYCGDGAALNSWGTKKNRDEMNNLMKMMTKFTDQGYGVVIGEYAVLMNGGDIRNDSDKFYTNFLNNCDAYGYAPMLWDCSDLFKRKDLKWADDNFVKTIFTDRSESGLSEEEKAAAGLKAIEDDYNNADDSGAVKPVTDDPDAAVAWLMFTDSSWGISYSVGNDYIPDNASDGIKPTDAVITGKGTYTIGIDFGGNTAHGIAFSAIGIDNGEKLFPGYAISIKEVLINGEPYQLTASPYTTSDDGNCTRVNLYNEWVDTVPSDARYAKAEDRTNPSPIIIDKSLDITSISITFDYYRVK